MSGTIPPDAASDDPWMAAMRRGHFAEAWRISDAHLRARLARHEPAHVGPRHLQHIWDGGPLVGRRVLVRCYHGLGDTVQFVRFAAPLRRIAREVIVWAQPALLPLIRTAAGVDRALALHDGTPDVPHDADIEIMELAHALRADTRTVVCSVPYLFPAGAPWRPPRRLHQLAVGIVWRAGDWDPHRSIAAELLAPVAALSSIRLFSLQSGGAAVEAERIPAVPVDADDPTSLAAVLRALDLVISVDTFVAHLAGALGTPVWLLLHAQCDWRWMERRTDCVWYPTMRLFRQTRAGDWSDVIDKIVTALEAMTRSGSSWEQTNVSDVASTKRTYLR